MSEPTQEEIDQLLTPKNSKVKGKSDTPKRKLPEKGESVEFDLDPEIDIHDLSEEEGAMQDVLEEEKVPERPKAEDVPINSYMEEDVLKVVADRGAIDDFSVNHDLGKITVTEEEKTDFLRSALKDNDVTFHIDLPGGVVDVKMANTREITAITDAVRIIMQEAGDIDLAKWGSYHQFLYAYIQVQSIGGSSTMWYDCEKTYTLQELIEELSNPENMEKVMSMSKARWTYVILAMRIAEQKYKLCNEGLITRSFFESAGTD